MCITSKIISIIWQSDQILEKFKWDKINLESVNIKKNQY